MAAKSARLKSPAPRFPVTGEVPASAPLCEPAASLRPLIAQGRFPGAVVATANAERVFSLAALGWRDLERNAPMTVDSLFWIASTTKPMTAAAALVLAERGGLSLDEPIHDILPEMKRQRLAAPDADGAVRLVPAPRSPTVRECLSHMGGSVFLTPYQEAHGIDSLPVERALTTFAMTPLEAPPGERYIYSNLGPQMVAAAIERRSGAPFAAFLQENVFNPLGMTETTFWPTPEQLTRLVRVYGPATLAPGATTATLPAPEARAPEGEAFREVSLHFLQHPLHDRRTRFAEAGGGLFSTAGDVVKFFQMLLAGGKAADGRRVLSEAAVRTMRTPQTPPSAEKTYGVGLVLSADEPGVGEHGGAAGNHARVDFDRKLVQVYLVQAHALPGSEEGWNLYRTASRAYWG